MSLIPQTFLDQILGPVAQTLIAGVGLCGIGILKRQTAPYDPRTGVQVVTSKNQWEVHITPPVAASLSEPADTTITVAGFKTTVSALELTSLGAPSPTPDMRLVLPDSREFRILRVDAVYSGNVVAVYNLSCAA